jgi:hypothetical protein
MLDSRLLFESHATYINRKARKFGFKYLSINCLLDSNYQKIFYQFTLTFSMPHFSEIDKGRIVSHLENDRTVIVSVATAFHFIKKET